MRPGIILAALAVAIIAVATFSIGTASAKDNAVAVGSNFFCDQSKTSQVCETAVTVGDTVTWTDQTGVHTVTQCTDSTFASCGTGFDSGTMTSGQTYQQTFASVGTTYYRCEFHPSEMKGAIVAQAATPSPTPAPSGAALSPTTAPALPSTGGAPGGDSVSAWLYGVLALGGVLLIGSGVSFAVARKRID